MGSAHPKTGAAQHDPSPCNSHCSCLPDDTQFALRDGGYLLGEKIDADNAEEFVVSYTDTTPATNSTVRAGGSRSFPPGVGHTIHIEVAATTETAQREVNADRMVAEPAGAGKTYIMGRSTVHGPKIWCRSVGEQVTIKGPGIQDGTYEVVSRSVIANDRASVDKIFEGADVLGYTNTKHSNDDPNRWAIGFKLIKDAT